jgi:tetratricopeptide (TPR) repeat protein
MILRFLYISVLLLPAPVQEREDLKRARAALKKGDYDGARNLYRQLARNRPGSWEPRSGFIRACLEQGMKDEAARTVEEFLKSSPGHPGAVIASAQIEFERGASGPALDLLKPLETDVRARALRARILADLGRIEEAVKAAEPLIADYNQRRDDLMKDDLFALAQGLALYARFSGDAATYKQVVQLVLPDLLKADPEDAAVRSFLGDCLLDKYNETAAAPEYETALQANPNSTPALVGLARILARSGRTAEALELCGRALGVNAASPAAHALKTEILLGSGDRAGALAAAAKGVEHNPMSILLRSLRAAARLLQGDPQWEEDVVRCRRMQPDTPVPDWELGRALLSSGSRRFEEAHAHLKRAAELNAQIPELLVEYGMSCLRVADEETGLRILREANRKDPFHVRVNNTVHLFRDFERDYEVVEPAHYRVRLPRSEQRWTEGPATALLSRAWEDMTRRYGFSPAEPVLVELFHKHGDFSVRTAGVPGLGALGACFGRVVTTLSPRAQVGTPFSWGSVLWHEMAHVFSLQLSKYRVPAWLTEGLATWEEARGPSGARREMEGRILLAHHQGLLEGVGALESGKPVRDPVLLVYLQGAQVCSFIEETRGFAKIVALLQGYGRGSTTAELFKQEFGRTVEEFDRDFLAWLDRRRERFRFRLPAKEPVQRLLADATADPKDAGAAARLAFALLDRGDEKEALGWARKAVAADPSHAAARSALGQALFAANETEAAAAELAKGVDDHQTRDTQGRALARLERWKEAAEAFAKAEACFPAWTDDPVQLRLNDALLRAKDFDGALRAFERLVANDPLDYRNRLKLAAIHDERQDWDRMARVLAEAQALETRDVALHDLEAALRRGRKDRAGATERTLAAIAILEADGKDDPEGKAARFCAIGEDWLERGDREKAGEYAQEALRLVSGFERARKLYDEARKK